MRRSILVVVLMSACGRLGFDQDGSLLGDGAVSGDGRSDTIGLMDANRVFVTKVGEPGAYFGGQSGANNYCNMVAATAGLSQTFVALVPDIAQSLPVRTLFASARGFMRLDGEPFADTPNDIYSGKLFNPLVTDEHGQLIDVFSQGAWTATAIDGSISADTCNDWSPGGVMGAFGSPAYTMPAFLGAGSVPCASTYSLYCFELSKNVVLGPHVTPGGRVAFVSSHAVGTPAGIGALDMICTTEATGAGLPGSYRAAVATTTSSIQSRFALDGRSWVRPDGTLISQGTALFGSGNNLSSFLNQHADGSYIEGTKFLMGAASPITVGSTAETCNNWTSTTGMAPTGLTDSILGTRLYTGTPVMCSALQTVNVLCLEE